MPISRHRLRYRYSYYNNSIQIARLLEGRFLQHFLKYYRDCLHEIIKLIFKIMIGKHDMSLFLTVYLRSLNWLTWLWHIIHSTVVIYWCTSDVINAILKQRKIKRNFLRKRWRDFLLKSTHKHSEAKLKRFDIHRCLSQSYTSGINAYPAL